MRYKVSGAIAACWQAKAGGEPPFAGWERLFFLRIILIAERCAPALPHYTQVVFQEEHLFFKSWRILARLADHLTFLSVYATIK